MTPQGLKPYTHQERQAIVSHLVPLWQHKFGENLVAVAATASFARGDDRAYSDLEFVVFLKELPPLHEDQYLQRIVDGLLIEAVYVTEEAYLREYTTLSPDWYVSSSAILVGVYNSTFVERLMQQVQEIHYPREQFVARAAKRWYEVQESFGKVLSAVDQNNREGVSLLVFDATLHVFVTLSFLNQQSFTTFATFVAQARAFRSKPARFDELLDLLIEGQYGDLQRLQAVMLAVFEGVEQMFQEAGWQLYDDSTDPNIPNKQFL